MKKAYRVHIDLDIRVIADNVKPLSDREFKQALVEMAFDEIKQRPEEFCDFDNIAAVEEDKQTPYEPQTFWAIFNGKNERVYRYGMFRYAEYAEDVLKTAKEKCPDAGLHVKKIEL